MRSAVVTVPTLKLFHHVTPFDAGDRRPFATKTLYIAATLSVAAPASGGTLSTLNPNVRAQEEIAFNVVPLAIAVQHLGLLAL